jgi:molybdenum cofactor sulfurtransferase
LRFFGANPELYDLVFVANATSAMKLVMDAFRDMCNVSGDPQRHGFWYGYHAESHTSAVGVRESTNEHYHMFPDDDTVESWICKGPSPDEQRLKARLFAYPGQSNMTGRRLPLSWPDRIRRSGNDTYTMLDAAALAPTYPMHGVLRDSDSAPDFTAVSFHKIFGFPDLGGLIVRKASGDILSNGRRYFGGGTVSMVTVVGERPWFKRRKILHDSLEDGTLPFHCIIALGHAIETHERLYGPDPMERVACHTAFLAKYLFDSISSLRHSTGVPVCRVYKGEKSVFGDRTTQGATVAFNALGRHGNFIPYSSVADRLAEERGIFVRSGSLCNPGSFATLLGFDENDMKLLWDHGHHCAVVRPSSMEILNGRPTGVVRVTLGAMTTTANIDNLITFLRDESVSSVQFPVINPLIRGLRPVITIMRST